MPTVTEMSTNMMKLRSYSLKNILAIGKSVSSYGAQNDADGCDYNEDESNKLDEEQRPRQNSFVTIFSLCNTMMGTSLLSMPWAIKQAGFVNGIVLLIVMAGIMAYTCYRVLDAGRHVVHGVHTDFTDAVRMYLGKISGVTALFCSLLSLLGGAIVYWILMSNFLYHVVMFIYYKVNSEVKAINASVVGCNETQPTHDLPELFKTLWSENFTVPLYLIVLFFPIFNFKSPTFFIKFNAFGDVSVLYLLIFVAIKAGVWGINLDLNADHYDSSEYSPEFKWSFPALTGVAAFAYLVQNSLMAIVRNQTHPENNTRDLIIAYVLVCFIYIFMGAFFYASFPGDKSCVEDNLLNNLPSDDTLAFVARVFFFFQMACIIPQLLFIFRIQFLHFLFAKMWPGRLHVLLLNAAIVTVCVSFAIFLPKIGHILSFVGAFCGFSYAFAFPCSVYIMICYKNGTLTWIKTAFHSFLILLGLANFGAQFVIIGHTS